MRAKMVKCKVKWGNVSKNGETRAIMVKREQKWRNVSYFNELTSEDLCPKLMLILYLHNDVNKTSWSIKMKAINLGSVQNCKMHTVSQRLV